jgi:hypothetical protein
MHIGLFVLGVATAVVGFAAIVYGIPVNEFSFGNTLIVSGTVALVGGFLLFGLAAVVRQLKRLAESDHLHQASMPLSIHSADPVNMLPQPGLQASQFMPSPAPPRPDTSPRMPAPSEPALSAPHAVDSGPPEWLRPKEKAPGLGGQTLIEEIEASLPPVSPPPPLKVYDQSFDPRLPIQARANEPVAQTEQVPRPEPTQRAVPPVEHPAPSGLFDTVWPEIRPARHPETVARARRADGVPPPRSEAVAPAKPASDIAREAQTAAPEEPRPVAILKSGMIDGMSYTLYADGSIEAVLATGTVRFASIDALRFHLEQNS